jgi:hypothetical protein
MRASIVVACLAVASPSRADVPQELGTLVMADDQLADGTIAIRIDPKPASPVTVALVGYRADQTVAVATHATDARGAVVFDHLDRAGTTAYYAMALVPRGRASDRLLTSAIVLPEAGGERVAMRATAAIDELAKVQAQDVLPAGTLRIGLVGAADPKAQVTVVEASTGKILAHGAAAGEHVDLPIAARAGQVVYAETMALGHRFRSLPFQLLANAGSTVAVYVMPSVLVTYRAVARASDPDLDIDAELVLSDNAWWPYELPGELPLPRGFTHATISDDDQRSFTTSATGFRPRRPLPPGEKKLSVSFRIPATAHKATWSLDLPFGSWKSEIEITKEPGVRVAPPANQAVSERSVADGSYYVLDKIDVPPGNVLTFDVTVPGLPPIERACRKLAPDRSPLEGKPMPALPLAGLDGKPLDAAVLRGKPGVITFTATWVGVAKPEPATLDALARAVPGITALLVYSDANADDVRHDVDAHARYRIAIDRPHGDDNIGPVTLSWGTKLLPESYAIDRKGVVRYYFANVRDWGSPDAIACLRALAAP